MYCISDSYGGCKINSWYSNVCPTVYIPEFHFFFHLVFIFSNKSLQLSLCCSLQTPGPPNPLDQGRHRGKSTFIIKTVEVLTGSHQKTGFKKKKIARDQGH